MASKKSLLKFLVLVAPNLFCLSDDLEPIRIGWIPKYDTPFFKPSFWGCEDKAAEISANTGRNVTCVFAPPVSVRDDGAIDGNDQAEFIFGLMIRNEVDAMMVSVLDAAIVGPVIDKIVDGGIPVITFDSDAPDSKRAAYTGTDNYFMGRALGSLARQAKPAGGTYSVHYVAEADNLIQRMKGVVDELEKHGDGLWAPVAVSPVDTRGTNHIDSFFTVANSNEIPDVMVSVTGFQMDHGRWKSFVDGNRAKDISYIAGDQSPAQLEYVETGYAHGLVGQKPYDFGSMGARLCFELVTGASLTGDFFGTDMVIHTVKPFNLPELTVKQNLVSTADKVTGFILFSLVAAAAVVCVFLRSTRFDDPGSALMVSAGVLVMATTLIPLTFDDNGSPLSDAKAKLLCMSIPWLSAIGFAMVQGTLSCQTSTMTASSMVMSTVMHAGTLVVLNMIILLVWSFADPLMYGREETGRDVWDRVNDTTGTCSANSPLGYWLAIVILNASVALWTHYKSGSVASFVSLQFLLTGVPVLFVTSDSRLAFSTVLCTGCLVLLGAIFWAPAAEKVSSSSKLEQEAEDGQQEDQSSPVQESAPGAGHLP